MTVHVDVTVAATVIYVCVHLMICVWSGVVWYDRDQFGEGVKFVTQEEEVLDTWFR